MLKTLKKIKAHLFIIVLLIGGPVLALTTYVQNHQITNVLDHGKTAMASIDKVEWATKHHRARDYMLWVTFAPATGSPVKRQVSVNESTGKEARDDRISTIEVRYLPENDNVVFPAYVAGPSKLGIYGGLAMFAIGVVVIVRRSRKKSAATAL